MFDDMAAQQAGVQGGDQPKSGSARHHYRTPDSEAGYDVALEWNLDYYGNPHVHRL